MPFSHEMLTYSSVGGAVDYVRFILKGETTEEAMLAEYRRAVDALAPGRDCVFVIDLERADSRISENGMREIVKSLRGRQIARAQVAVISNAPGDEPRMARFVELARENGVELRFDVLWSRRRLASWLEGLTVL